MNELCVYQGTFNPIHNAHIAVALKVHELYGFEKIVFIPAFKPPHKNNQNFDIENAFHRLNMVEAAIKKYPFFDVSAIEFTRNTPSYTYDTISQIRSVMKPDKKINFIIGSDAFIKIESWNQAQKLKELVKFLLFVREDNFDETPFKRLFDEGFEYELVNFPFNDISSSEIREKIRNGENICDIVPLETAEYIEKYDVYKTRH